jgi:hypothetical protein
MNIWSMEEIRTLRYLVAQELSIEEIAIALGRSKPAVRNKACVHGISLRRTRSAVMGASAVGSPLRASARKKDIEHT